MTQLKISKWHSSNVCYIICICILLGCLFRNTNLMKFLICFWGNMMTFENSQWCSQKYFICILFNATANTGMWASIGQSLRPQKLPCQLGNRSKYCFRVGERKNLTHLSITFLDVSYPCFWAQFYLLKFQSNRINRSGPWDTFLGRSPSLADLL